MLKTPLPGKPRLTKWHSFDCLNSLKEFQTYKPGERDAITHDFRQVILDCELVSYAVCIDKSPWLGRYRDLIKSNLGRPDEVAMYAAVNFCHRMAGVSLAESKIGIVFDAGWAKSDIGEWATHYVDENIMKDRIASVSFSKVVDQLGLQGADLIATEAFWFNKEWIETGDSVQERAHFRDIRYGELAKGVIYRDVEIFQMLNRALEGKDERPIKYEA